MKHALFLILALTMVSCTNFDKKIRDKTGLDTFGWVTLGLSAKIKGEQLKSEYETLKAVEVTAQK